jgi:hypothetical protein
MKIHTYRVFYRYADDATEYAATLDARSEAEARSSLLSREPIIIVRVELVA